MCGLFGVLGQGILRNDLENVKYLGLVSQARGEDGSGVFQINTRSNSTKFKNNLEILHKSKFPFGILMYDLDSDISERPELKEFMNNVSLDLIMGHVRWATRGSVITSNAHPFAYNSMVAAHNGTLKDKKYEHATKTDSELFLEDINNRGIIDVINELNPESAYAVTHYDRNKKKLYLYRNEKRPLHIAFCKERNVVYWASESIFLSFVLGRDNLDHIRVSIRPHIIYEIDPSGIKASDGIKNLRIVHKFPKALEYEEKIRKEREEEERKKVEEELKSSVAPLQNIQQNRESNILSFPKVNQTKVNDSIRAFYTKCECGSVELNVVQQNLSRRGKPRAIATFDNNTGKFHCVGCNPDRVNKEVSKNVLN